MAESHVMSALVKKRSEILGEIQHCEALIKEYKENLSSLDATIHIFDSNYDLQSIKSKKVQRTRILKRRGKSFNPRPTAPKCFSHKNRPYCQGACR